MDAPVVFKPSGRSKASYRKRERASGSGDDEAAGAQDAPTAAASAAGAGAAASDDAGATAGPNEDEDTPAIVAARLEEARALQKYRRRELGISAGTMTRGDVGSSQQHAAAAAAAAAAKNDDDPEAKMRAGGGLVSGATKMGLNTAFTQQTKAQDVDQHMVDYVEKEMKKRKGVVDDVQPVAKDYLADLYTVPEHLRVERPVVEQVEGSALPVSGGILAMIPEVDLGIENKLKNIEDTERAKTALLEKRRLAASERRSFDPTATLTGSEVTARVRRVGRWPVFARSFRATRGRGRGQIRMGNPYASFVTRELTGGDWREGRATDELVLDRFKRREMQFWSSRGRGRR